MGPSEAEQRCMKGTVNSFLSKLPAILISHPGMGGLSVADRYADTC